MQTFLQAIIFYIMTVSTAGLKISSPSFLHNGSIPSVYTCEGSNKQPALHIANIPVGTKSFAIIMDDPDTDHGTFVHWVAWNIAPSMVNITENSSPGTQGMNGRNASGYTGPCPPTGTHHYHFKVYALDTRLGLAASAGKAMLETAMEGHILAKGEIIGLYKKIK